MLIKKKLTSVEIFCCLDPDTLRIRNPGNERCMCWSAGWWRESRDCLTRPTSWWTVRVRWSFTPATRLSGHNKLPKSPTVTGFELNPSEVEVDPNHFMWINFYLLFYRSHYCCQGAGALFCQVWVRANLRLRLQPKMMHTTNLKILITEQNVYFFRPEPLEPELRNTDCCISLNSYY